MSEDEAVQKLQALVGAGASIDEADPGQVFDVLAAFLRANDYERLAEILSGTALA